MHADFLVVAPCLISLAAYALAWCVAMTATALDRRRGSTAAPPPVPASLPCGGVTILKPLCGADEELEHNLLSFFRIDHEPVQLVFGVAAPDDAALPLVRRLARRFPGRDVAIVVGADPAIANPKVAILESLLPHARHDVILLSDSNVRLRGDEIAGVLPEFDDPDVGMVYQPVVAVGERTVAAAVENLHYTEYAAFLTIGVRVIAGQHTVNAKGQWVRREALEAIGGFVGVRDCGADDYELSRLVAAAGYALRPAAVPVTVVQRDWSWTSLTDRNLRHAGLRWRICPWAYPLELLFNPIPWAVPAALFGAGWLAVTVVAAKTLLEAVAARALRGVPLEPRFLAVVPLKDVFYFGCWFVALFARTATWRGRPYRLCPGGRIEPLMGLPAAEMAASFRSAA